MVAHFLFLKFITDEIGTQQRSSVLSCLHLLKSLKFSNTETKCSNKMRLANP